ncbi:hypothetical protein [uncultured Bilophila sp.]|uniref:hypothetical protein n=1 Tax=uncultured Bilophila sp. TaxID=529385 RepID=UPI00260811F8|nr:hypothetical protein [uncultured Bilophila sp.]
MHKTMLSIAAAAGVALGCALTGMAAETQVPGMPLIAGADGAGGYAADVLEKLLPVWQPPAGASGVVTISLRIGSDGRPTVKPSASPAMRHSTNPPVSPWSVRVPSARRPMGPLRRSS